MDLMYDFFQNKINMDDPINYETIVKDFNEKDIQDFANLFLSSSKSYKVVFKPIL
jgi:zinc protease